jgi:hypothetical protein
MRASGLGERGICLPTTGRSPALSLLSCPTVKICVMPQTLSSSSPQIVEAYRDYSPPFDVTKTIRLLLRHVRPRYLAGLQTVVLTNLQALSHDKRRRKLWSRGHKVASDRVRGTYHQPWKGNPAWIELFVDNIVRYAPSTRALVWFPLLRAQTFGEVLYHEIGHHIHKTQQPQFREREDVADDWGTRLGRTFVRRRYWYLMPVAKLYRMFRRRSESVQRTAAEQ